jgi:hypothetical protein
VIKVTLEVLAKKAVFTFYLKPICKVGKVKVKVTLEQATKAQRG